MYLTKGTRELDTNVEGAWSSVAGDRFYSAPGSTLGIGYNFTRFAEDELGDFNRDASGVFFRVTAQY